MKKNKKAEQRKGDKLGPTWLGPYLITAVHDNGNYMVANPKTGKVLATRCPQSECKLYIDLVLGLQRNTTKVNKVFIMLELHCNTHFMYNIPSETTNRAHINFLSN